MRVGRADLSRPDKFDEGVRLAVKTPKARGSSKAKFDSIQITAVYKFCSFLGTGREMRQTSYLDYFGRSIWELASGEGLEDSGINKDLFGLPGCTDEMCHGVSIAVLPLTRNLPIFSKVVDI